MSPTAHPPDPARLGERLAALPGVARLSEALAGLPAYLVGGAVRDLLLGRERSDIDVVVEGDLGAAADRLGGAARAHERFRTATVGLDGLEVDLAEARSESYAHPGALPEVRPASLEADLARRDYTINAMAVPLAGEPRLVDPHGGLDDLGRGLLRVLHERSFADDPTRALRAARYAARFGFEPEPGTERLLRAADLASVSSDRVEAELRRIAREPAARRGLELAAGWGLVELRPGASELVEALGELLAAEPWAGVAARADAILAATLGPPPGVDELVAATPERPSAGVAAARGRTGVELALARVQGAAWLDDYVARWRHVRLEIGGDDLLAAGVPQGPALGEGLAATLAAKLDGEVSGREAELELALEVARGR